MLLLESSPASPLHSCCCTALAATAAKLLASPAASASISPNSEKQPIHRNFFGNPRLPLCCFLVACRAVAPTLLTVLHRLPELTIAHLTAIGILKKFRKSSNFNTMTL
jgi:hypothetical protein